jgi:uncharacterized protein (TIGR02996 family)
MSDGDALLEAILAEPDADLPRLMFADWLDEFGGAADRARAEFIRVQVELASGAADGSRLLDLTNREKQLLHLHREAWLAPLREYGGPLHGGEAHGQFRRGFVEVVWMPAAWFLSRAEVLFASTPARELRVTRTEVRGLAAVLAHPHFRRLTALDLSDRRLGDEAAGALAEQPASGALRTLRLRGCGITDVGAFLLADAEFDWPLAELDVQFNPVSAVGLAALRERFGKGVVAHAGRRA